MPGQATESNELLPRLQDLGFIHDPFGYPEAEKMPDDMDLWEKLFVEHPGFNEVRDTGQSAVLLAARGGGKTAHRLYFSNMLATQHPNWLVINYASFAPLAEKLPSISTSDHFNTLIACMAEALLAYVLIPDHKEKFLEKQPLLERKWFWAFLNTYSNEALQYISDNELRADFIQLEGLSLSPPFRQIMPLDAVIKSVVKYLNSLGITRLFLLIDGVDGSDEFKSLADMTALVNPLLNGLSLLSIQGVVWKFFLPQSLEQVVLDSSGYETGRLHPVSIKWDHKSLIKLLNSRLEWASSGDSSQQIEAFCSQELSKHVKVEKELTKMAIDHQRLGAPRALLQSTRQLFLQSDFRADGISPEDWEKFYQSIQTQQKRRGRIKNKQKKIVRIKLVRFLDNYFNLNDLRSLCFELDVDYDNIEGSIKKSKIENLYLHFKKEDRLFELVDRARKHRPRAPWNDVFYQQ